LNLARFEMTEPMNNLASFAILVQTTLLFIILLISYFLQIRKIQVIHESVVSIFLGGLVGALVSNFKEIKQILKFDDNYFFYLILPPIILNCGYDLNTNHFFKNIGPILIFAFLGTFISTLVIGNLVYLVALTGIHGITMSYLDCLTFGAILSSTGNQDYLIAQIRLRSYLFLIKWA
jgi:NhaP-type Na+/H+ or K+/H+ antiporter